MKHDHFPFCQPNLEDCESGYLANNEVPERNEEDFKMMLKLMGVSEKPQKPRKRTSTPAPFNNNVSDDASDSVARFSERDG
jgi:hypothetical protein